MADIRGGAHARAVLSRVERLKWMLREQRVLFLLVGGLNTVFSTVLFAGLVILLGPNTPSAVSRGLSWMVSVILVFFAYRRVVFRVSGNITRDFLRFVSVNVSSLLLNAAALTILADVLGLHPIPTQIAIAFLIVIFNYLGHKYFSFRR